VVKLKMRKRRPAVPTFTLTKCLKSYIPRFPRREMSFARAGKTAANEAKYPYIVEVPIPANGLNVELNRQIVGPTWFWTSFGGHGSGW
jgi:hypothetical protein